MYHLGKEGGGEAGRGAIFNLLIGRDLSLRG